MPDPIDPTPTDEPVAIVGAINTAISTTIGVLTITGVFSPEVGGALGIALGAWIAVGAFFVRRRVTPVG